MAFRLNASVSVLEVPCSEARLKPLEGLEEGLPVGVPPETLVGERLLEAVARPGQMRSEEKWVQLGMSGSLLCSCTLPPLEIHVDACWTGGALLPAWR